jgi:hypothetical protein
MPKSNHVSRGSGHAAEVPPPRERRKFSPAEKLRIVREAAQCREPGEVGGADAGADAGRTGGGSLGRPAGLVDAGHRTAHRNAPRIGRQAVLVGADVRAVADWERLQRLPVRPRGALVARAPLDTKVWAGTRAFRFLSAGLRRSRSPTPSGGRRANFRPRRPRRRGGSMDQRRGGGNGSHAGRWPQAPRVIVSSLRGGRGISMRTGSNREQASVRPAPGAAAAL